MMNYEVYRRERAGHGEPKQGWKSIHTGGGFAGDAAGAIDLRTTNATTTGTTAHEKHEDNLRMSVLSSEC